MSKLSTMTLQMFTTATTNYVSLALKMSVTGSHSLSLDDYGSRKHSLRTDSPPEEEPQTASLMLNTLFGKGIKTKIPKKQQNFWQLKRW